MNELKGIIEDIQVKLAKNAYRKEEHVRVAIIARICQALGCDIWDPDEFYTEYPINLKSREGSVDVALFHSLLKDKTPDVFFELKSVGKLKGNIESSEDQLQEYNYYNTASITILTDGRQWRFYLSSASGTFVQKLFCTISFIEDDPDHIISILMDVLAKKRFSRDAVNSAQNMLNDLKLSREIERAKNEANTRSDDHPDLNKYQLVRTIMKERGHDISIDEIKRLWDIRSPAPAPISTHTPIEGSTDSYAFSTPSRVFVIDKWFDVKNWGQLKSTVYSYVIEKKHTIDLVGRRGINTSPVGFRRSAKISGGLFVDLGFSADNLVRHCKTLLIRLGYDPVNSLIIETLSP
ncbi:MAG: hypothetical protein U1C33_03370, partial [Candidatus Cloacimonadaceae bacterium]|nr:hypothetical protein [Candidatus Cloacimonadaceae bacterium]